MFYEGSSYCFIKFSGFGKIACLFVALGQFSVVFAQPFPADSLIFEQAIPLEVFWQEEETFAIPKWETVGKPTPLLPKKMLGDQSFIEYFPKKNILRVKSEPLTLVQQKIDYHEIRTLVRRSAPMPSRELFYSELVSHNVSYLDANHGLPDNYPNVILQAQSGEIWMGMNASGLVRYDGHRIEVFRKTNGLEDEKVKSIAEDKLGNIWVATSSGLSRFDGKFFTRFQLQKAGNLQVNDIQVAENGAIWFATEKHGIIKYDNGEFLELTLDGEASFSAIRSLAEHASGKMWLAAAQGIFSITEEEVLSYTIPGLSSPSCIEMLGNENIWWGDTSGINYFRSDLEVERYTFPNAVDIGAVQALADGTTESLWIGTRKTGLWQFDGTKLIWFSKQKGVEGENIRHIMVDQEEQIWASNAGFGILKINQIGIHPEGSSRRVIQQNVHRVYVDSLGNNWLATSEMGLLMFDGQQYYQYGTQQGVPQDYLLFFTPSRDGHLWLGYHEKGLVEFAGDRYRKFYNQYYDVEEDKSARKWMIKKENILLFDGKRFGTPLLLGKYPITNILQSYTDPGNRIWLYFEDKRLGRIVGDSITFFQVEQLEPITGKAFWKEDANRLWVVPLLDQIIVLSEHGAPKRFPIHPDVPLPHGSYWDYRGHLWLTTDQGPVLCTPTTDTMAHGGWQHFTFDRTNGLKSLNLGSGIYSADNRQLWFSTNKGQHAVDLPSMYTVMEAPANDVVITGLKINEHFVDFNHPEAPAGDRLDFGELRFAPLLPGAFLPDQLVLPSASNTLSFQFSNRSFNPLAKVRFQYRMIGQGHQWSEPTEKVEVDYRAMSPGRYSFQVRARNGLSEWGSTTSYSFRILPPWWQSKLALLIYGLFLIFLGGLVYRFLKRRWSLENTLKFEQSERKRLKELNHYKSRLYTNLTHEFRTPLTVILGMIRQIRDTPKKYLNQGSQIIERNSQSLLKLVNEMLDLSKLESNTLELRYEQHDVIIYLRYLVGSFESLANSRNLSLHFYSPQEACWMDIDPERLKQVVSNLIGNALKFTPPGGAVEVIGKRLEDQFCITVRDNGIGIAPKNLSQIFDRFFQVEDGNTHKNLGTGIGLTHARELTRLMRGHIQVESQLGKGTDFTVFLPICNNAPRTSQDEAADQLMTITPFEIIEEHDVLHQQAGKPLLLLVEDNADIVVYLKSCLSESYQFQVAYNGRIGIEIALDLIPDLIISDVMMPEKDGLELCNTLKRDRRTSHIPIILLTAKVDLPSKLEGLSRGADAYLGKPFEKEELLIRVSGLLDQKNRISQYLRSQLVENSSTTSSEAGQLTEVSETENEFISLVQEIVSKHYQDDRFGLPQLCHKIGMSRSQLFRKMKALIDMPPSDYIRYYRLTRAKSRLEADPDARVSEVAYEVGFKNPAYFSKLFFAAYGCSPSQINSK